jgi:hypothetical protein
MGGPPEPGSSGRLADAESGRGILVLGAPRAGATWVGQTLGCADDTALVNEPDNETSRPFAARAKLPLGRYPVLAARGRAPGDYEKLWTRAFSGAGDDRRPRSRLAGAMLRRLDAAERWNAFCAVPPAVTPRLRAIRALAAPPPAPRVGPSQVVVKSAHSAFAAEWIAARFRPRVVVVLRHPYNVIASWTELGWGGCSLDTNPAIVERYVRAWDLPALSPSCSRLTRVAWEVGLQLSVLRSAAARHQDWVVVRHEDLCQDPAERFRALSAAVGLAWTDEAEAYLRRSNRAASGLVTMRVAEEQPERWRTRMSTDQVAEVSRTLRLFPEMSGSL